MFCYFFIFLPGAQDDLKQVTKIAYALIREFGMNDVVGQVSFPPEGNDVFAVRPYSKYLTMIMDEVSMLCQSVLVLYWCLVLGLWLIKAS